jgi:hypothetical protein
MRLVVVLLFIMVKELSRARFFALLKNDSTGLENDKHGEKCYVVYSYLSVMRDPSTGSGRQTLVLRLCLTAR